MTFLGIETATEVCSVGIVSGDTHFERSLRESRIHSEKLLVLLGEVMDEAAVGWDRIDGLALSAGPGAFTGLRIGASAAKGLLSAHARGFVAVPTFVAINRAYQMGQAPGKECLICMDAKQDEWYVQKAGPRGVEGSVAVLTTDAVRGMPRGLVVLTDVPGQFRDHPEVLDLRQWCSGAAVAEVGRQMLERGELSDVRTFEPSYWKDFVVRTAPKVVTPPKEAKEI